ncbi:ankyrin repeat domain-containing protein [Tsuneonella sp. SYSU-LHT278]|uniref:ankyrin repeat domain-containing protein n=1 Tax=Tsuneonella sediminis TaxID=3416089 RepID=UPI003F7A19F8
MAVPIPAMAQQTAAEMELVSAAQDCRTEEARRLIASGTDVDTTNSGGYTPLMMTASYGCLEVAEMLVEAGADTRLRHPTFGTAADLAKMNRYAKIQALLANDGARPAVAAPPAAKPAVADRKPDARSPSPVKLAGAGTARGWPPLGTYRVGQEVLYSGNAGKTWERGTIRSIDPVYGYNIEGVSGSYDPNFVVAPERAPFWTEHFMGDWRISVPMAMGAVTDGRYVYRTVSGGLRLPPLRISGDGSYSWRVQEGSGERLVKGRWMPNPQGPGVILKAAEQGADWLVYNNTRMRSELGETVILSSECCSHYDGTRLK